MFVKFFCIRSTVRSCAQKLQERALCICWHRASTGPLDDDPVQLVRTFRPEFPPGEALFSRYRNRAEAMKRKPEQFALAKRPLSPLHFPFPSTAGMISQIYLRDLFRNATRNSSSDLRRGRLRPP